jgi:hypothetical protein
MKLQMLARRTARMMRELKVSNRKAPQRWAKPNSIVNAHSYKRFNHDINCSAVQTSTILIVTKIHFAYECPFYLSACDRPRESVHVPACGALLLASPSSIPTATTLLLRPYHTTHTEESHSEVDKMAAAIKALNAKIRANPVADYFCSTR